MSKLKSPPEKKTKSLLKDARNIFGECSASSRRNIAKGKQRGHQAVRRAVAETLRSMTGADCNFDADTVEGRAREQVVKHSLDAFKKKPDAPLAVVIDRKRKRRVPQQDRPAGYVEFSEQLRSEARLLRKIRQKSK